MGEKLEAIPIKKILCYFYVSHLWTDCFFIFQKWAQKNTALKAESVDPLDPSIGVTEPLGLYDPLGWLDPEKDPASKFATFHANFERRRAVERKHGRIAMAAVVGMLFHNADIEFPGYLSKELGIRFSDVPNGMNGLFSLPLAGLTQIVLPSELLSLLSGQPPTTLETTELDMDVHSFPMFLREMSSSTSSIWRSTRDVQLWWEFLELW